MQANIDWLQQNHDRLVQDLADLVAIRSVSTDGQHQQEIEQSAGRPCAEAVLDEDLPAPGFGHRVERVRRRCRSCHGPIVYP